MKFTLAVALGFVTWATTALADEKPTTLLKYGDNKADGKKSLAGTGQMIRFELPSASQQLRGLRLHGARYGHPQPPDEEIEITITTSAAEDADIVHTEFIPYAKFTRGDSRWNTIKFEDRIEVPPEFWITLNFNAERTKGVYVSYDTSTEGQHSRTGLPGSASREVDFAGDWMVQGLLTKGE